MVAEKGSPEDALNGIFDDFGRVWVTEIEKMTKKEIQRKVLTRKYAKLVEPLSEADIKTLLLSQARAHLEKK